MLDLCRLGKTLESSLNKQDSKFHEFYTRSRLEAEKHLICMEWHNLRPDNWVPLKWK